MRRSGVRLPSAPPFAVPTVSPHFPWNSQPCSTKLETMATYIYETIPRDARTRPRRFEVQQKMSDPPLKRDPETGLPVRRIIVGGSGLVTHGASILSMNVKRSKS